MRNYGFDYLVEKVQVLNEMGRSSTCRLEKNENVASFMSSPYRKTMASKIFEKWKPPAREKTFNDYLTEELYKIINKTQKFPYDSVDQYITKLWNESPNLKQDYADYCQAGSQDSNKRSRWILSHLANKVPNVVTSPQFFEKVTNPENVENYIELSASRAPGKNRQQGYRLHIQSKYSMSADDFAKMKAEVWPIIVKINRRSRQFLPPGILQTLRNKEQIISDSKPNTPSGDLFPLETFVETLISFRDDPYLTKEYRVNVKDLTTLIDMLERRVSDQKPVSKEKLYSAYINNFPNGMDEYITDEYENDLKTASTKGFSEEMIEDKRQAIEDVLDIYTPVLLKSVASKGVITEPEIEVLSKWKELIKQSDALEKQEISAGRKAAGFTTDEIDISDNLSDVGKAADKRFYAKEKESPTQKPKKPRKQKQEDEENDVMGYFSEQVRKDSLLNNIGEFKERGFKKPVNYHHWLSLND